MEKLNNILVKKNNKALLWVTGVLTVLICAVMNLFLIPAIEKNTGGLRCFDMNAFGLGYEQARQFVSLLGQSEKNLYLHVQLPLDFVYPIAYGLFFALLLAKLPGRATPLLLLPAALAAVDYAENICSIIMLKTDFLPAAANIARVFTSCKSVLMYVTIACIFVLLIIWLVKKKKQK